MQKDEGRIYYNKDGELEYEHPTDGVFELTEGVNPHRTDFPNGRRYRALTSDRVFIFAFGYEDPADGDFIYPELVDYFVGISVLSMQDLVHECYRSVEAWKARRAHG